MLVRLLPLLCFACANADSKSGAIDTAPPDTDEPVDSDVADTDVVETVDSDPVEPVDTDLPVTCAPVSDTTRTVVVTDIDETLTTSDNEWLTQIALPGHDPEMRPSANDLMAAWEARGYRVIYLSARGEGLRLLDGTTARDATYAWLDAHHFPYRRRDVYLADGVGAILDADTYKADVLAQLQDEGFELVWAYGNADTDITAYKDAGIPNDHQWLVGDLAGQFRVNPIPTRKAYRDHILTWPLAAPCGY